MSLKRLLVSEQQLTEEILDQLLSDYVRLVHETRRVTLTPAGGALTGRAKVVLVLAAQHAWRFLAPDEEQDTSLPIREIEQLTGLPGNTLRPILKDLTDRRLLESTGKGVYRLPAYALTYAAAEIGSPRGDTSRPKARKGSTRTAKTSTTIDDQ